MMHRRRGAAQVAAAAAALAFGIFAAKDAAVHAAASSTGPSAGGRATPGQGIFGRMRRRPRPSAAATAMSAANVGLRKEEEEKEDAVIIADALTTSGFTNNADNNVETGRANSAADQHRRLDPSQVLPSHTRGGSLVGGLFMALRTHLPPRQIARLALSGCQIGILYVLFRLTWQAVQEAWEEVSEELDGMGAGGGGGGGGVGVKEEHDRVWLDHAGVEAAVQHQARLMVAQQTNVANAELEEINKQRNRPRGKRYTASFTTATELARRLRSAGMPMALPPNLDPTVLANTPNSVQHVLKSLTRTEGRLLSSTLLSPADDGDFGIGKGPVASDADARREQINDMWNSIGGLGDVKDSVLDLVFPLMMNQASGGESSYYGGLLSNPPGVLLYGPPGCGKTLLVKALASTVNARVLCVSPSTLMRKYVGETELQVRALFSLARKIAPTIIFVDEVDGLFRERGSSDGLSETVSRDLKLEFMQLWDGIRSKGGEGSSAKEQILVVGATNRPFDVDSGFLRRMPRSFFVGLPDRSARIAVLKAMLKSVPLSPDFDVEAIAKATEFYSPSDLKELLRTAALAPLREARFKALNDKQDGNSSSVAAPPQASGHMPSSLRSLTTADCLGALSKVAPTQLSQQYVDALSAYASRSTGRSNGIRTDGGGNDYTRSSRRPYQHPSGYYVHKANDGSFMADIGTINVDGHHQNPSYEDYATDGSTSEDDDTSDGDDEGRGFDVSDADDDDFDDGEL